MYNPLPPAVAEAATSQQLFRPRVSVTKNGQESENHSPYGKKQWALIARTISSNASEENVRERERVKLHRLGESEKTLALLFFEVIARPYVTSHD
jgi:hypothetical protein